MNLTRNEILRGNYLYSSELIKLRKTNHFIERLEQRGIGIDCIPTIVRITKNNIYCAETEDKELTNVVIRLHYNYNTYVFLCFNPKNGVLKTIWFRDKRK